jgi:hypothetical protein
MGRSGGLGRYVKQQPTLSRADQAFSVHTVD